MSKKPVVLMILDGYGLNKTHEGNAVYEAKKPVMDRLMKECPFVEGQASGLAVGLPDGQMGNSEVGHLNMGAGRIVYQELTRITKSYPGRRFLQELKSSLQLLRTQEITRASPVRTLIRRRRTQPYHPCLRTLRARKEKRTRQGIRSLLLRRP